MIANATITRKRPLPRFPTIMDFPIIKPFLRFAAMGESSDLKTRLGMSPSCRVDLRRNYGGVLRLRAEDDQGLPRQMPKLGLLPPAGLRV